MRICRNVRYTLECLEHKLSLSGLDQFAPMSVYSIPVPIYMVGPDDGPIPPPPGEGPAPTVPPHPTGPVLPAMTPVYPIYLTPTEPGDDKIPPNPDGGTAPTIPPETPTGPVLPGYFGI